MLALERRREIIDLIKSAGNARVSFLAKHFKVTEETIRRDLDKLEAKGQVIRSHGGAVLAEQAGDELSHDVRQRKNWAEKTNIATKALEYIKEGDTIFLDGSSTAWYLAQQIHNMPLTVITNAAHVTMALSEKTEITVISTGGRLSPESLCYTGPQAENVLDNYQIDKSFLSAKAVDLSTGLRDDNEGVASLKRRLIDVSEKNHLLVDYTKFNNLGINLVVPLSKFDVIITNDRLSEEVNDELEQLKLNVVKV